MLRILPPLLAVSCLLSGATSAWREDKVCYGDTYKMTSEKLSIPFPNKLQLLFTPSRPSGPIKLVMDKNEVKDPRYVLKGNVLSIPHVTERDEGVFSLSTAERFAYPTILRIKVLDCSQQVDKNYGSSYSFRLSRATDFLEFTPSDRFNETRVLWNRSSSQTNFGKRGYVEGNVFKVTHLTQDDNGHYNLRNKYNDLISRKKITVTENKEHYLRMTNEDFIITFDLDRATVTFFPNWGSERILVMKSGQLIKYYSKETVGNSVFTDRIQELSSTGEGFGIEIKPLKTTDTGRFEVKDKNGNLALVVELEVEQAPVPISVNVGIGFGVIMAVILCCCCVSKCCCGDSSSKSDGPDPETPAELPVHHHDDPSPPSYTSPNVSTHANRPTDPLSPPETNFSFVEPPVPPTGWKTSAPAMSLDFDCLSSDTDLRFELKELTVPSAPPLSSDSNFCDVYTSDKLNFL
ncbi:uncharacterized protein LOC115366343 isoform X2 [Myripristis murdjan]|uniref:uncharacterized protein LOC115366343 isoform X2 n=1 Tax=Myripristis murdjan TaxID=586833 RepID=UPI001175DB78|nr:uncharacterized protein LOC115366343 isoform X2 [Myripristis murdjan]